MLFILLLLLVGIVLIYIITTQNRLVRTRENISNALSQIGVNQTSRFDILSQLAKATASYSKHEYRTLMDVIDARQTPQTPKTVDDNEARIQQAMTTIHAVAEQYPDLKASVVYQNTMAQMDNYENKVRTARMVYNDTVTIHNRLVRSIPSSIVASLFGFTEAAYLENDPAKSEMPDLNF
ncbi:LemA family protein [Peptoniphilus equinus]|uniref:LemA family protein n=1 Tax=Peptoniphilus equinus TaxID=3016343 RepID=A0ABY7QU33_9FIRM|nr:LemA family protein [Peptoniphilus equinus]WBW49525.1 LemA family protein [Peptoniphilus equinus]